MVYIMVISTFAGEERNRVHLTKKRGGVSTAHPQQVAGVPCPPLSRLGQAAPPNFGVPARAGAATTCSVAGKEFDMRRSFGGYRVGTYTGHSIGCVIAWAAVLVSSTRRGNHDTRRAIWLFTRERI
jgi:hypothetical protein